MPLITRKRVWTKQPQTATSIDWFDPLSKDLVAAFVFSNGLRDLVTGQFAENKGGVFVDSQLGRCFQAITAGINLPWDLNCTDDNVTVTLIEYREVSPTNYWFICDARQGSTGFAYGLSGNWTEPAVGAITAPGYKVTSTCKNATYQNAVKTSVTNGSNFAPRANLRLLGRYTDVDAYTNGAVAAIYIHKRNITQGEATSLYEQPWRLLKKQDKRIWIPSAGGGDVTIACTPGNATTAGITAGISSATTIACNVGNASTAGVACALPTTISCNAGNTTTSGIACSLPVVVQCGVGTATTAGVTAGISLDTSITIACNAGNATAAGVAAGISLDTSITISCNVGTATTAGVTAGISSATTITCNAGTATTAGVSATFPQSLSCNVGNATTSGITAQVDIAGQIVIGCNAGTATTAGISAGISSAFVLACNVGNATTIGTTAYFPQVLQCSPGNAIALGINATFTVAGPTAIVCNVGNATASGISFSFGGTLVDAPNGSGPAIIRPQTIRPPNLGGIRI